MNSARMRANHSQRQRNLQRVSQVLFLLTAIIYFVAGYSEHGTSFLSWVAVGACILIAIFAVKALGRKSKGDSDRPNM